MDVVIKASKIIIGDEYTSDYSEWETNSNQSIMNHIKAREAFINIANTCLTRNLGITLYFETVLNKQHDSGEIDEDVYTILWWNMEKVLANYRQCLGLNPRVKMKTTSKAKMESEIDCSICLDKHAKKDVLCIDSCKHEFGKECLTEWSRVSKQCPLCRADAKKIYGWIEKRKKEK
jgi:hypothetical protein